MRLLIPMRNWLLLPLLALALILVGRSLPAEDKVSAPENVAIVNGTPISRQSYNRELKVFMQRNATQKSQITEAQLTQVKKDILENLIDQEILYQESQKQGIAITDQAIDDQLAGIRKRFPSEEAFKKALDQMQISQADVKTQIRRGLAIKELMDKEIIDRIVITTEETESYYNNNPQRFKEAEQVKASHIIIRVNATSDEKTKAVARQKIEAVQEKIKAGQDFAELAKEYSDGPSGAKGGDLGYFKRGQMVPAFEDAAFALEPNQISDIVETQFGYHLIKVYDKKPERIPAYAEVKGKITQQMQKEKMDKAARQYVGDLKKKANIEKLM